MLLTTEVRFLKGVGEARARVLENKGIRTVEDLLYYVPRKYQDRRHPRPIENLVPGETATVVAPVVNAMLRHLRRGPSLFEVTLADGFHRLTCKWFNSDYLERVFRPGQLVAVFGHVEWDKYSHGLSINQPEYEILGQDVPAEGAEGAPAGEAAKEELGHTLEVGRIVPIYETAAYGRLNSRFFRRRIWQALEGLPEIPDPLPPVVREKLALPTRRDALRHTHFPEDMEELPALDAVRSPSQFRLIFEELFFLETGLELKRARARRAQGQSLPVNDAAREKIRRVLPFSLTAAQKRVMQEIEQDMAAERPMNRLLQGDVGSGKTIVAVQAAIIALENGCQVAIMAPTEILAAQHLHYFHKLLGALGYQVAMLAGSQTAAQKDRLKHLIARGLVNVVVGTHALLEEDVEFAALGLIVVDEQHRFGVVQRLQLMKKGRWPDVLVMTATPIPRTLSLTLFGDLEVSTIDELPPGRRPILTRHKREESILEVYEFVRSHVKVGRQVYIVYPVVEEMEKQEAADPDTETPPSADAKKPRAARDSTIKSAITMHARLSRDVFPEFRVGLLYGRMKSEEKEQTMADFQAGRIQILVATTVIEVGVDVANASVMVIEHAERFGLAQLHQLRGRVGRGAAQSYCILVTYGQLTDEGKQRIGVMRETNDGFRIAETDLRLRGPGEFFGTRQSGLPAFRIADLLRDAEIIELARREARGFIESPPSREALVELVAYVREHWSRRYGLVQVG
jgi:ATP-dependent DNA helicase RecG